MTTLATSLRPTLLRPALGLLAIALGASQLVGCKVDPTNPKMAQSKTGAACKAADASIDNGDDGNNQTEVLGGRGGYWYTFSVGNTQVWPLEGAKGGTFEMSPSGAESSPYGARMKGKVSTDEGTVLAGMGMNFVDPKGPYDASKYGGISFWAKVGEGSVNQVRLKVPDNRTDPDGGLCSECYNDFGMDLSLSTEWEHYVIPFKTLKQLPGWGRPKAFSINSAQIFGIQFQVDQKGADFDLWVDQIRFTGCEGG